MRLYSCIICLCHQIIPQRVHRPVQVHQWRSMYPILSKMWRECWLLWLQRRIQLQWVCFRIFLSITFHWSIHQWKSVEPQMACYGTVPSKIYSLDRYNYFSCSYNTTPTPENSWEKFPFDIILRKPELTSETENWKGQEIWNHHHPRPSHKVFSVPSPRLPR